MRRLHEGQASTAREVSRTKRAAGVQPQLGAQTLLVITGVVFFFLCIISLSRLPPSDADSSNPDRVATANLRLSPSDAVAFSPKHLPTANLRSVSTQAHDPPLKDAVHIISTAAAVAGAAEESPLAGSTKSDAVPAVQAPAISPPPTAPAAQKHSLQTKSDMDAFLDELVSLHRKDVAAREATTMAPEDFPTLYTDKALVVTMADGGYGDCAVRLVETVRGAGRWGGPMVVIVPTGQGTLPLAANVTTRLEALNASLVPVGPEPAGGAHVRGAGSATQYAKVVLLVNASFRKYDSILYLDADGTVTAPLQPLLEMPLPANRAIALPTWPSAKVSHESLYFREIDFTVLNSSTANKLRSDCPDRTLVGITAWFLINPKRLLAPAAMRAQITAALELWRPAFKFNDQGLWNVIFYNNSAFYPLCLSGPYPTRHLGPQAAQDAAKANPFTPFLVDNLSRLASVIEAVCGPGNARRRQMYNHGLKDCVPLQEWQRKMQSNKERMKQNQDAARTH